MGVRVSIRTMTIRPLITGGGPEEAKGCRMVKAERACALKVCIRQNQCVKPSRSTDPTLPLLKILFVFGCAESLLLHRLCSSCVSGAAL